MEPEYSPLARAEHVEGTVVLEIVVTDQGRAAGITVLRPLGSGLDEQAQAAIEKWEFTPAMKDGRPVNVLATVEVNFRLLDSRLDNTAERYRTWFNSAAQTLHRDKSSAEAVDRAVKTMQDLSRQHYPAAMHLVGLWETTGEHVARNPKDGLALIQKAAAKNYGPALYEIATRRIEGRGLPKDAERGLEEMRQAAVLGSPQAQFYLGIRYETGSGVPRELDRAGRYFRQCAARGAGLCQYRLGNLLFKAPGRPERDYIQAIAWLQLAAEQGVPEAKDIVSRETALLTPEQTIWVKTLKDQLGRR
jgi:TonB family protein